MSSPTTPKRAPQIMTHKGRIHQRHASNLLRTIASEEQAGRKTTSIERITAMRKLIENGQMPTVEPLLPLMFVLDGEPLTLNDHFVFEAMFHMFMARRETWKTARQVGKTLSTSARALVNTVSIGDFTTLIVTPLYEQIRRISSTVMRPLIDRSPMKQLWTGTTTEKSVLQRTFKNYSKILFSFALLDADRIRGIPADAISLDEIQDMDRNHLPIIYECLSASEWRLVRHTGTPKTLDNTLEDLWSSSSQAEWFTPCSHCLHWNIACVEHDLLGMLGPMHSGIGKVSEGKVPGTVCAKCGNPIDPRYGHWRHRRADRQYDHAGRHIPQCIMPMHYEDPDRWQELLAKQQGWGNYTIARFYNEVLGESYDVGAKILTLEELMRSCCLPWENRPNDPKHVQQMLSTDLRKRYRDLALGVDWGGGGEDEISFTNVALCGLLPDGKIDVLWGAKFLTPLDHIREARQLRYLDKCFRPEVIAHDYTGAGVLRETMLVQSGMPIKRIMPIQYVRSGHSDVLYKVPPSKSHGRLHWRVDKARSLLYTCGAIKFGLIRFFKDDHKDKDNPGLVRNFLALVEDSADSRGVGQIYYINRAAGATDDFAHAVNLAAVALWSRNDAWPDFARAERALLSADQKSVAGDWSTAWGDKDIDDNFLGHLR